MITHFLDEGKMSVRLGLHDAICRPRFYSILLIRITSPSNSNNDLVLIQKNHSDKSYRVTLA